MPLFVIIIDVVGLILALIGFHLAFRQSVVRGWWRRLRRWLGDPARPERRPAAEDPVRYALRISGVMLMVFGLAMGLLITLFDAATRALSTGS